MVKGGIVFAPGPDDNNWRWLGGWGGADLTLHTTTWETFRPEPEWLSPNDVAAEIARLRSAGVSFRNTVVASEPALTSPCDF